MRKNFAQILEDAKIDIKNEYQKFYDIFYNSKIGQKSVYQIIDECFAWFYFRGTCLSLEEFNQQNGFQYDKYPTDITIYGLVGFMEYIYNLIVGYQSITGGFNVFGANSGGININLFYDQINRVAEKIGYMHTNYNGITIFVEKSPEAIAVAESNLIPDEFSYKLISYNHYSMRGNLIAKKETILRLANILEGKRHILRKENPILENDLFYIFNNFDLRHNNCDSSSKKYKSVVAQMDKNVLEEWYDETYQMCLLAFMIIDNVERKNKFDDLKNQ